MITIEKMQNKEIETMSLLAQDIWREYSVCFITPEQIEYMLKKFQSSDSIKQQIDKEDYEYYFIKDQENYAGYFAIQPKRNKLFLSKIYIKKEYRNKGVGKKSLEFIKKRSKALNLDKIELTVNKYNENTIKAYKKWGFTLQKEAKVNIGNDFVMDDYILELKI